MHDSISDLRELRVTSATGKWAATMEDPTSGESECGEHGRSGDCSDLPRTSSILALEVPRPRKLLGPTQTGMVGHPSGRTSRNSISLNLAKSGGGPLGRRDDSRQGEVGVSQAWLARGGE